MADRTVRVRLEAAIQGYVASMAQASASTKKFGKNVAQMSRQHADEMRTVGTVAAAAGVAVAAGFAASAKAAMSFESSFAGMRKTIDASEAEFDAMADANRQLAKEIPLSVNEINAIGEAAGQLGIAKENVLDFTRTMADLGVATNMSSDEAATAFARFANITQMSQGDFDRLGSTVVDLGNNLATTEGEISAFALRLAGAGAQVGLTEAEILGLGGALSSVGINAEAGGTAVSKVMIEMASAAANGGDELAMFAEVAGMSAGQFATAFEENAAGALVAFIEGLGQVEEQGGSLFATLEELGITEQRMRDAMLRTAGAGDLVARSMGLANDAWAENTALTEEAAQRYGTLESQIQLAKNAVYDAGIEVGQYLTPALGTAAEAVAGFAGGFSALPDPIKAVGTGLAGIGGTASLAAGGFLLLAPKIVATRDAMKALGVTDMTLRGGLRKTHSFLTSKWTIAFAGAALMLAEFGRRQREAEAASQSLTGHLDDIAEGADVLGDSFLRSEMKASGVWHTWQKLGLSMDTLRGAMRGVPEDVAEVEGALEGNRSAWDDLLDATDRVTGGLVGSKNEYRELHRVLGNLGIKTEEFIPILEEQERKTRSNEAASARLTAQAEHYGIEVGRATDGSEDFAGAIEEAGRSAYWTAEGVFELTKMLDDLIGVHVSAEQAAIRLEQGWDDLTESLKENGTSLDITTEKGRANRQAILDQANAIRDDIEARHEQGASLLEVADLYDQHVGDLRAVMEQAGLTEAEIDEYIATLGLTPEEIVTAILAETGDAETALGRVAHILGRIPRFTHTTVDVTVNDAALRAVNRRIAQAGGTVGARAKGGPVGAGKTYLVGEEGPEFVTFGTDGYVHDAATSAAMAGGPYDSGLVGAVVGGAKNRSGRVYGQALDEVARLMDRWDRIVEAEEQAARRADLSAAIGDAQSDVRAAENTDERARATDRLSEARARLADHDRDAARAAEQAAIADARAVLESRARRVANREQFEFDRATSAEQIAILDARLDAEQRYTDEWMDLHEQRERILRDVADEATRIYEDELDALHRMLDDRERILDRLEADETAHLKATSAEHKRYAEAVAQAQRKASDAIQDAVDARARTLRAAAAPSLSGWDHRAGVITEAVGQETDRLTEWAGALDAMRGRGLSDAVVEMLGLDDGPEALAQLRRLAQASDQELADLNDAVARQMATVNATVRAEQKDANSQLARDIAGIHDDLSGELRELQDAHHTKLAEMNAAFADDQRALRDELAQIGADSGRSYIDAIAEGIASGIPGLEAHVRRVQDLMRQAKEAEARASTPTIAGQVANMRASLGLAADPESDAKWQRWVSEGSRTMAEAERRLKEKAQTFDVGGVLQPGYTLARNATGQPEYVLTGAQMASVAGIGAGSAEANSLLRRLVQAAEAGQVIMLDTGVIAGQSQRRQAVM